MVSTVASQPKSPGLVPGLTKGAFLCEAACT